MVFPSHRTFRHFLHSFQWFTRKNNLNTAVSSGMAADGAPGFSVLRHPSDWEEER